MKCDKNYKKSYFYSQHNIQKIWCKNGFNPINLVFRVANQVGKTSFAL